MFSLTSIAKAVIVNEIGYAAQAGDIVSSVTVSRGASASAVPSTVLALYSSSTNDITTASFVTSWPAVHTGLANTIQKFDIRPVYALQAGTYYWAVLTRAPAGYLHAAQNVTHQQLSFPLASPFTPPATLGEVTRSAVTVEGVLFVEITNVIDRTVKTLGGTQAPQAQRIARFTDASYRAAGVQVDHNLYTTTGNLVEVRDNGSFTVSGDGNQSLLAKFSTDGVTWSADQTITIVDPT